MRNYMVTNVGGRNVTPKSARRRCVFAEAQISNGTSLGRPRFRSRVRVREGDVSENLIPWSEV